MRVSRSVLRCRSGPCCFDLNYENNILFWDEALTAQMTERQQAYLASSRVVTFEDVEAWTLRHQLWNNAVGMLGPVRGMPA